MALGGGIFTSTDKPLPGIYHNFVSAAKTLSSMSERGTATVPYFGDWGPVGTVKIVESKDFWKSSKEIFGYDPTHPKMLPWRELFLYAEKVYVYRMGKDSQKAQNKYSTAIYPGKRGNDVKIVIQINADDNTMFDVSTYLDNALVDKQITKDMDGLTDNRYVSWNRNDTEPVLLEEEAGMPLTGGTNGTENVSEYQDFLSAIEGFNFNALCCPSEDAEVNQLFAAFTQRMREENGVKFQTVVWKYPQANYEGVISLENEVTENDYFGRNALVYWTTGIAAGCAVNESNTNRFYNGELQINTDYTQNQLAEFIRDGKFVFHNVGEEARVLEDINTLTSFTEEKGSEFSFNQTIRVLDQTAVDTASIFAQKYLGKVPNDKAGHLSLWNDILRNRQQLQDIRAIEDYDKESLTIESIDKKTVSVQEKIQVINAMAQLYVTTTVE